MRSLTKVSRLALAAGALLGCATAFGGIGAQAADAKYTFAMITHAQPGDTFWDIIRKGANAAAAKDNVKLVYLADPTANKEAQLITNVTQQHVDGIAVTLAFPDAEAPAVKAALAAGIPIVGFNAGTDQWKDMGLLGYAGQDETVAGKAVGDELNKEGAKSVVCLDQQQGAVQLEARCDGIKSTFKGDFEVLYATGYDMPTVKARMQAKLQQNANIDYVVTLGRALRPGRARRDLRGRQQGQGRHVRHVPPGDQPDRGWQAAVGDRSAALCRGL